MEYCKDPRGCPHYEYLKPYQDVYQDLVRWAFRDKENMMKQYQQEGESDCLLACLATAVQRPINEIWSPGFRADVEENKGTYGDSVDTAFELAGLRRNKDYWQVFIPMAQASSPIVRQLLNGRRALLQVPSLNIANAAHILYWDGKRIFDPSRRQVYSCMSQLVLQSVWIFKEGNGICEEGL